MAVYGNHNLNHYQQYLSAPAASRPSLLDDFLSDPRTTKMVDTHSTKFHMAILVKRGKILASATNKIASRSNGASSRGCRNFIHAEKNLLRSVGDYSKLRGADIYVMRIGGSMEFMYSQPCNECTVLLTKCMREYGLRNVYFTRAGH